MKGYEVVWYVDGRKLTHKCATIQIVKEMVAAVLENGYPCSVNMAP